MKNTIKNVCKKLFKNIFIKLGIIFIVS